MKVRLVDTPEPPCQAKPATALWERYRGGVVEVHGEEKAIESMRERCGTTIVYPLTEEQVATMGVSPPPEGFYYCLCEHQVAEEIFEDEDA